MTRFAGEAMERMNEIIHSKLVHTLGEETANLRMRVGLHSGAVTAGVLRGERARLVYPCIVFEGGFFERIARLTYIKWSPP